VWDNDTVAAVHSRGGAAPTARSRTEPAGKDARRGSRLLCVQRDGHTPSPLVVPYPGEGGVARPPSPLPLGGEGGASPPRSSRRGRRGVCSINHQACLEGWSPLPASTDAGRPARPHSGQPASLQSQPAALTYARTCRCSPTACSSRLVTRAPPRLAAPCALGRAPSAARTLWPSPALAWDSARCPVVEGEVGRGAAAGTPPPSLPCTALAGGGGHHNTLAHTHPARARARTHTRTHTHALARKATLIRHIVPVYGDTARNQPTTRS
jgi:hypothetical protein